MFFWSSLAFSMVQRILAIWSVHTFHTPRPNLSVTPAVSWSPTFAFQSPILKRTSYYCVYYNGKFWNTSLQILIVLIHSFMYWFRILGFRNQLWSGSHSPDLSIISILLTDMFFCQEIPQKVWNEVILYLIQYNFCALWGWGWGWCGSIAQEDGGSCWGTGRSPPSPQYVFSTPSLFRMQYMYWGRLDRLWGSSWQTLLAGLFKSF